VKPVTPFITPAACEVKINGVYRARARDRLDEAVFGA